MRHTRRYPAIGGVAAWRIPIVAAGFAAAAAVVGDWDVLAAIGVVALIADVLERAVVFEVSDTGLVRALAIGGLLVGPARVIPWPAVAEIATGWRRPRDFTGLKTVVSSRDGERITFGSEMGLNAYRDLVSDVVRHVPQARRAGLTEELLAERAALPGTGGRPGVRSARRR